MGTEGVLCSQCSENYNRDASVCTKCSDSSLPVRLSLFLAVVGLIVTIMAVFQKRLKKKWRRFAPLYRDVLRIFSIMVTFQQISTSVSLVIEVPWPRNFVAFMSYFKVPWSMRRGLRTMLIFFCWAAGEESQVGCACIAFFVGSQQKNIPPK